MAEPNPLPIVQNHCRFLHWKEMYVNAEPDHSLPGGHSGHFWCVHTQTVLGPDGNGVTDEDCTANRMCFESL